MAILGNSWSRENESEFLGFSEWWRVAIPQLLGWSMSATESWISTKRLEAQRFGDLFFNDPPSIYVVLEIIPAKQELDRRNIRWEELVSEIGFAISTTKGINIFWGDDAQWDWAAIRTRVNNVLRKFQLPQLPVSNASS